MKRILAMLVSVVLVATMAIGGSIAYLQDTDEAVNVMTMGSVYIDQIEQERDEKGELIDYVQAKPLYPAVYEGEPWEDAIELETDGSKWPVANDGAWQTVVENSNVIDKFVTVHNEGKSEAYVRTIIAYESDGDVPNKDIHIVHNDTENTFDTFLSVEAIDGLMEIDGTKYQLYVYTYKNALPAGETTIPSLKQVYMDKGCNNADVEAYGDTYDILVVSQAVQVPGFEDKNKNGSAADDALNEAFGVVSVDNNPWVGEGMGGEKAPTSVADVIITSVKELKAFRDSVNDGNTYAGKTVMLGNDINLSGIEWEPINNFKGIFDGNGHTISNMTVEDDEYAGLFGILNGTVRSVKFTNATVIAEDKAAGVVAGEIFNTGLIENVTVTKSSVTSKHYSGGIVGYLYGSVKNCVVKNTTVIAEVEKIGDNTYDNGDKVGGIVGYFPQDAGNTHAISGNYVEDVTIMGYRHLGGIVGYAGEDCVVTDNEVKNISFAQDINNNYKEIAEGQLIGSIVGNDGDSTGASEENGRIPHKVDSSNKSDDAGAALAAVVTSFDDLKNALNDGKTDIVVKGVEISAGVTTSKNHNIDFIDCTLTGNNAWKYVNNASYTGCTFNSGSDNAAIHYDQLYGELVFTDCEFKSGKVQIGTDGDSSVTFNNCTFAETETTSIWAEKGIRVYCPAEFNSCEFNNRVVLAGSNGLEIAFNNCTMNGGYPVYYTDNTDGIIRGGNVPSVTIK